MDETRNERATANCYTYLLILIIKAMDDDTISSSNPIVSIHVLFSEEEIPPF